MGRGSISGMDLTPYLQHQPRSVDDEPLLSVAITGRIALAMKGRFSCVVSVKV